MLGHGWSSGGYWVPMTAKLDALAALPDEKLAWSNRASLFGFNCFIEYLSNFAEQVELLHELLSQDSKPWTPQATAAVRGLVEHVIGTCR